MALIRDFIFTEKERQRPHGPVDCSVSAFQNNGATFLQLETHGSADRKIPGKVSQSIQLDREAARKLKRILEETFGL